MTRVVCFAATVRGLAPVLGHEIESLGGTVLDVGPLGVSFEGTMETVYRTLLFSRTASRVVIRLAECEVASAEDLYEAVRGIPWHEHMSHRSTFAVRCQGTSGALTHTHYAALKVKDAIADAFRERLGKRPDVNTENPDVLVDLALRGTKAYVGIDLSLGGLHRRGYRKEHGEAPLREHVAAGVLLLAGWPTLAERGAGLCDPMCGSGTLVIEAALMALDVAPGLVRGERTVTGWLGHDVRTYERAWAEARTRDRRSSRVKLPLVGMDTDPAVVTIAQANARRAGVDCACQFTRADVSTAAPVPEAPPGLVVTNPPYGERLGSTEPLQRLYRRLGDVLRRRFQGYKAAILTADPALGKELALRPEARHEVWNGPLECRLLVCPLSGPVGRAPLRREVLQEQEDAKGINEALANRLRKNLKRLGKWAEREDVSCYRIYDADIPEFALAIDRYEEWVHVQEYAAPPTVDVRRATARLNDAIATIASVLAVPPDNIFLKVRRKRRRGEQYEKHAQSGDFREVREGGYRFLVNLVDYIDTGLFLDHRLTRAMIRELAQGRRFLNLFGYTGTATVYAAKGGARSTLTVDLSSTYIDWARRNFRLNGLDPARNTLVRADVLRWLEAGEGRFGLIFVDPPTFSNSKGMQENFDVQRDHVKLLEKVARLLAPGGEIIFSTNARRFKLNTEALGAFAIEDITRRTISPDFARRPNMHRVYRICRR